MQQQRKPYLAALLLTLSCALAWSFADLPVARYFHELDAPAMRAFFKGVTKLGESQWYLVGGLVLFLLFRTRRPPLGWSGLFLFMSVALSGIAANIFKFFIGKARPKLYFREGFFGIEPFQVEHAWTSFPSGHSATAFSLAMALALLLPRGRHLFLAIGALIALSRVWLYQHYVSDIIAGSALGAVTSLYLYNRYYKNKIDGHTGS